MIDLFGLEQQTPRINDRRETAALVEVLKALNTHPAVAWCERMNTGADRMGGRFVQFGFKGCPDVSGQLRDGRLLDVEVNAKVKAKAYKLVSATVVSSVVSAQTKITASATLQADFIIGHLRDISAAHGLRDVLRELGNL